MDKFRVAVTGVGVICANGHSREEFWESVVAGKANIGPVELFDTHWTPCKIAGEVKSFDGSAVLGAESRRLNRSAQFAIIAAAEAIAQSALSMDHFDPYRVGVVMGTCQGTLPEMTPEDVTYPPFDFMHSSCDAVAHFFGMKGPRAVISNACAAGANAIGLARDKIWSGEADVMLGGGTDALTFFSMAGFSSLQSLDLEPCSPYGRSTGLTLGEGAAVLVLEALERAERRGARVLAELRGYGLSADAYHPTAPDPSGRGAALAMRRALSQAGLPADIVDYVNGHGTGTPANDEMERRAFLTVFGPRAPEVPVSSTKSMIGHALGAAGAIEAAACVLAVERDVLPPTVNLPVGANNGDFDFVPDRGRPARVDVAMSNNYAFGGSNASLVLSKPTVHSAHRTGEPLRSVSVTGIGAVGGLGLTVEEWWARLAAGDSAIRPIEGFDPSRHRCQQAAEGRRLPAKGFAASSAWRRMDRFERMCVASARLAWNDAKLNVGLDESERVAVIFATANGSLETMAAFGINAHVGLSEANPALFPHTALNAAAGQVCSTLSLRGPTSTITAGGISGLSAIVYATELILQGEATTCLVVSADQFCESLLKMLDIWPGVLTSGPVRPFDQRADGTALGEAAVTLVLEQSGEDLRPGAQSYGQVLGYGMTGDVAGLGGLSEVGTEWAAAMRLAMERSGVTPPAVNYCAAAASGISTVDRSEARALAQVFPDGSASERLSQ
jgi:3-oxoacyl-[acyl-carrier-protein] synthase II